MRRAAVGPGMHSLLSCGDGSLAFQYGESVVLYDIEARRTVWEHPFRTRSFLVPGLAAHPHDKLIAAASMDEIHWIDLESGRLVERQEGKLMRGIAIAPDGGCLVAAGLGSLRYWRPAVSGAPRDLHPKAMWEAAAFTSGSRDLFLAGWDGIWKVRAGTWEADDAARLRDWVVRVKVVGEGSVLVMGGKGGLSAVDFEERRELWRCSFTGPGFDLSPDGRWVISMSRGGWIAIDLITGEESRWGLASRPQEHQVVWSVSVSRNGYAACCHGDGNLALTKVPQSLSAAVP